LARAFHSFPSFDFRGVLPPVPSGNAKWFDRHSSQEVCPYNRKFSAEASETAFAPMERLVTPDARALARTFLATSPGEFAEEFRVTPLSRAKLVGLKRTAAAVLANVGTIEDMPALVAALAVESDAAVLEALRTALAACAG
jgi:epoxyqueuosine reductase QueG